MICAPRRKSNSRCQDRPIITSLTHCAALHLKEVDAFFVERWFCRGRLAARSWRNAIGEVSSKNPGTEDLTCVFETVAMMAMTYGPTVSRSFVLRILPTAM